MKITGSIIFSQRLSARCGVRFRDAPPAYNKAIKITLLALLAGLVPIQ